ncbi:MAG: dTMP kinase [Acidobacteriota bacterium]|nr:dTMP kinase [Acidobacteriota bacterium]MDE3043862.1 dTMP kinase [Acidobacteriota bacterium]MDE3106927.1 dTMP kinase [Acidobacteriota bacterium]
MSVRGVFVAFEGVDASGKSTQARRVAARHDALFTFEPGDSVLGVELRRWLLDAAIPMDPETEALLMLSDRSHHARRVIAPALAQGRSVVTDRYYPSSLAYQGYGRGVDLARLRAATELAIDGCLPDLVVLLDVSLEVANERRARDHEDRFESADLAFHERVRAGYLELAAHDVVPWVVVDANLEQTDLDARVDDALAALPWTA